ncbi:MAG: tyrosine-type recombinase/integrase [Dorea sp.]|nr:tyrosine-type recombinase/integrase [Dorea sp.]
MDNQIYNIISDMSEVLNIAQMKKLQEVLITRLSAEPVELEEYDNFSYLDMFLTAKRIEGCSERTIEYYQSTVKKLLEKMNIPVRKMTTEVLREYLAQYQGINNCSKVTIDNVRRNLSSFFSWLEEEDYILKSPIRRIHKVKTKKVVKEVISDENLESLRDGCCEKRDLAMIDILVSTGMRVGELVNLNISDLDFEERECVVYGKGDKERKVYFDARSKLHIQNYLLERNDSNPALFVSLNAPYQRLQISGVETRLRELGRKLQINNIHPHKFRRTMATKAIDKGMPIEQVQKLLGHQQIDTTMEYAMVNQSNVKSSHRKFIA